MFFYIFHAKVVVLLEASSNFKVRLADEISSRAFFFKDVRSGMQAKMRWRVFAFGGVSQNVEKHFVFVDYQVFFQIHCVFCYN